ncbi:hypothetical protein JMN32_15140, partial [Fulvivirga sp. 29W222]
MDNPAKFQDPKIAKWTNCPLTDSGNIINNVVKAVDNCPLDQPGDAENVPGNALKQREPTLTSVDNPVKKHLEQLAPEEIQIKAAEREVLSGYTREKVTGQNEYPPCKTEQPCAEQKKNSSAEEIITGNETPGVPEYGTVPGIRQETREKVPKMRVAGGGKSESGEHTTRSTFLKMYCGQLWSLALELLYKDRFLTDSQLEAGEQQIMKFYEPVSTEGLPKIHQMYVERIRMAARFI